jgi:hypothetical protein
LYDSKVFFLLFPAIRSIGANVVLCAFDWTIRITDLLIVLALFAGPIVAVQIADRRQRRQLQRGHREWIFRTLMTTKSSPLAPEHINAINLVGLVFRDPDAREQEVVEAWKLYRGHLDKGLTAAPDWWVPRQLELLDDLLYKIAVALQLPLTVSEIKNSTSYYPAGHAKAEQEIALTRQLWLEVLENKRALPITNELKATEPRSPSPTAVPPPAPRGGS